MIYRPFPGFAHIVAKSLSYTPPTHTPFELFDNRVYSLILFYLYTCDGWETQSLWIRFFEALRPVNLHEKVRELIWSSKCSTTSRNAANVRQTTSLDIVHVLPVLLAFSCRLCVTSAFYIYKSLNLTFLRQRNQRVLWKLLWSLRVVV